MKEQSYTADLTVDATPREAFAAINNVTKWWTENLEGSSHNLDDEFTVRFGDIHMSKQKLVELIPDRKVVWLVTDAKLNFVENKSEWTSTKIVFELHEKNNQTQINFTHIGLVPEVQCYNGCTKGWDQYIKGSLYKLLKDGTGEPGKK
jgi:hypothetical protein